METYLFEKITDENYEFTRILYKKSFGVDHSLEMIRRKYDTSVFGIKNIGYFAVTENRQPAAYYGVFPMVMEIDGEDIHVAQSGDTMTAPEHRNKGLFIKLARMSYQLSENTGIRLIFGFPNENSYPGFQKKLDWSFYGTMQKFTIKNHVFPLCEISAKFKVLSPLYRRFCQHKLAKFRIQPDVDNTMSFRSNIDYGSIKKDLIFFQYKLDNPDNYLIMIEGFTLLIKVRSHLLIGDTGYFQANRTGDFLKVLKKLSLYLGCRSTIISVSKNFWLFDHLKSHLNPTESLPIGFLKIDKQIEYDRISFTHADYDTF